MGKTIFTDISETTLFGARDRVLDDLNELTHYEADRAIKYVQEFLELDAICENFKEKEKKKEKEEEKPYIP